MRNFRKYDVWQRGHELTLAVYRATDGFPAHETYGLTSQVRRATSSIPTNIAEGSGRFSDKDFARFVDYSAGSLSEVDYLLQLSHDLGYLSPEEHLRLADPIPSLRRKLRRFHNLLRR